MSNSLPILTGLETLNATLKKLPPTLRGSTMRQALRAGAKVILREAKSRVTKKGTGGLKRALTTKVSEDKAGNQRASVGANMPDGAHIHLVEFGTKERFIDVTSSRSGGINIGGGASRGRMPSQPFLRPAFDHGKDAALHAVSVVLERKIDETVR